MSHWRDCLDPAAPAGRYLNWKEVARRTSLSRTTAWRLQRRDEFPRPYPISPGRVGHLECEVEAWMASRARLRGAPPALGSDVEGNPEPHPTAGPVGRDTPPAPAEALLARSEPPGRIRPPPPARPRRARHGPEASQQIRFNF